MWIGSPEMRKMKSEWGAWYSVDRTRWNSGGKCDFTTGPMRTFLGVLNSSEQDNSDSALQNLTSSASNIGQEHIDFWPRWLWYHWREDRKNCSHKNHYRWFTNSNRDEKHTDLIASNSQLHENSQISLSYWLSLSHFDFIIYDTNTHTYL